MMASPMKPASAEQRHAGVACVTARDFRWERGDIKSISLLGNVLARQMSADKGAVETIMFRDGFLTEASASNVWVVHEGALLGPPKSEHVLEGIRVRPDPRAVRGVRHRLQPAADPRGRRGLRRRGMLSSATKEVLPSPSSTAKASATAPCAASPGPVYAKLYEAYQRAKQVQSI